MLSVGGVAKSAESAGRIAPEPRLERAAHQFEAMMLKELLAPVTRGIALLGNSEENGAPVLSEFASECMAGALSSAGGMGIAERIVQAVSHSGNTAPDRAEMRNVEGLPE